MSLTACSATSLFICKANPLPSLTAGITFANESARVASTLRQGVPHPGRWRNKPLGDKNINSPDGTGPQWTSQPNPLANPGQAHGVGRVWLSSDTWNLVLTN